MASKVDVSMMKRLLDNPTEHVKIHGVMLPALQAAYVIAAESAIDAQQKNPGNDPAVITCRGPRQFGKNEAAAILHYRTACRYYHRGGEYVRAAPTYKPQTIRSIMRLNKYIAGPGPSLLPHHRWRMGYIMEAGRVAIHFLSADAQANVVGATASLALDIDEAHEVDEAKFENDFAPMTAKKNAPIILWGVAAQKRDLLYKYRMQNFERGREELNVQVTASQVSEIDSAYAAHYESRRSRLGPTHPIIRMNYDLEDVDESGCWLSPQQIRLIMDSEHERMKRPGGPKHTYVCVIDVAGENEEGEILDPDSMSKASRDSTWAYLVRVRTDRMMHDWPRCEIVAAQWWVGKPLGQDPGGMPGQQENLLHMLKAWRPSRTIVDARGIGAQVAAYLRKRFPGVQAYNATADSVDEDVCAMLAMINNGQLKMWRNDRSPEYNETRRQLGHADYEITKTGLIKLVKPKGDSSAHIDAVKALSYVPRALNKLSLLKLRSADIINPL